jgi:hypothetical protein
MGCKFVLTFLHTLTPQSPAPLAHVESFHVPGKGRFGVDLEDRLTRPLVLGRHILELTEPFPLRRGGRLGPHRISTGFGALAEDRLP